MRYVPHFKEVSDPTCRGIAEAVAEVFCADEYPNAQVLCDSINGYYRLYNLTHAARVAGTYAVLVCCHGPLCLLRPEH